MSITLTIFIPQQKPKPSFIFPAIFIVHYIEPGIFILKTMATITFPIYQQAIYPQSISTSILMDRLY